MRGDVHLHGNIFAVLCGCLEHLCQTGSSYRLRVKLLKQLISGLVEVFLEQNLQLQSVCEIACSIAMRDVCSGVTDLPVLSLQSLGNESKADVKYLIKEFGAVGSIHTQ